MELRLAYSHKLYLPQPCVSQLCNMSLDCAESWGPDVQIHKPLGTFHIQTTTVGEVERQQKEADC